jgi:hypothetical protein
MNNDRRKDKKLSRGMAEKILSREQLSALLRSQRFGWRLWFIRKPQYLDFLPVLYNVAHNHFGILEPDGHINTDVRIKLRSEQNSHNDLNLGLELAKPSERTTRKERRKNAAPAREDVEELFNPHQLRALRDMESSGWKLLFVRTSLFQAPVIVITTAEGDIFATLDHDGQLNMTPDLSLREDDWPAGTAKQINSR